uniref:Putative secreted protein n=1 Tax=Anopheles triannulatus TaxID=58253 RepID=A0A2M4B219_9DIPT
MFAMHFTHARFSLSLSIRLSLGWFWAISFGVIGKQVEAKKTQQKGKRKEEGSPRARRLGPEAGLLSVSRLFASTGFISPATTPPSFLPSRPHRASLFSFSFLVFVTVSPISCPPLRHPCRPLPSSVQHPPSGWFFSFLFFPPPSMLVSSWAKTFVPLMAEKNGGKEARLRFRLKLHLTKLFKIHFTKKKGRCWVV